MLREQQWRSVFHLFDLQGFGSHVSGSCTPVIQTKPTPVASFTVRAKDFNAIQYIVQESLATSDVRTSPAKEKPVYLKNCCSNDY